MLIKAYKNGEHILNFPENGFKLANYLAAHKVVDRIDSHPDLNFYGEPNNGEYFTPKYRARANALLSKVPENERRLISPEVENNPSLLFMLSYIIEGSGGGAGIPAGGAAGQVLTKKSAADGDADWATPSGAKLAP